MTTGTGSQTVDTGTVLIHKSIHKSVSFETEANTMQLPSPKSSRTQRQRLGVTTGAMQYQGFSIYRCTGYMHRHSVKGNLQPYKVCSTWMYCTPLVVTPGLKNARQIHNSNRSSNYLHQASGSIPPTLALSLNPFFSKKCLMIRSTGSISSLFPCCPCWFGGSCICCAI